MLPSSSGFDLFLRLEDNCGMLDTEDAFFVCYVTLLYFHLVKQVITLHGLRHGHDLIGHEPGQCQRNFAAELRNSTLADVVSS